ncbi:PPM family protein phosphatase [Gammaproteobacteria bacterium]
MKKNRPGICLQKIHRRFEVAAVTDRGSVRTSNEDGFLVDPHLGLVVVADGMSGQSGGSGVEASALTIKSIYSYLSGGKLETTLPSVSDETILSTGGNIDSYPMAKGNHQILPLEQMREAIAYANSQIYSVNHACGRPDRKGIGATLGGIYWPSPAEGRAIIFHVGDCRVYRLRDAVLHRLTQDHSACQKWIDNGMQGIPPARNLILRAVGPCANVEADISTHMLLPGDVILLCSNGLTLMVSDRDIKALLYQVAAGIGVEQGALQLVDMAKANGGKDNITVVLGMI